MNPVVQALLYGLIGAVVVFTAFSLRATFRPRNWVPSMFFIKVWLTSLCAMFVFLGTAYAGDRIATARAERATERWYEEVRTLTRAYEADVRAAYRVDVVSASVLYPAVGESRNVVMIFPDGDEEECVLTRTQRGDRVVDTFACDRPSPDSPHTANP